MKKTAFILLLFSSTLVKSQDIHFSQFLRSSFFLNPSLTSFQQNDYKATLQRRSQWKSVAEPFNTFTISVESKDLFPSHSVGLQFLNDIAGDAKFKTTGFNLSYSKLLKINKITLLSVASSVGFFQRSLFFDDLVFIDEENYQNISFWYPDINIGLSNQYLINKNSKMISGISLFHLNHAKQSLTGDDDVRLKNKINIHSSVSYSVSPVIFIIPKLFYSIKDKEREAILAFDTEYLLKGDKGVVLKSGISYRVDDAIIYNFGAEIDNLDCLVSYDFNTSSLSSASNNKGGFEFSIIYVWDIKREEKILEPKECPKYL